MPFWKSDSLLQDIIQEQPMETRMDPGLLFISQGMHHTDAFFGKGTESKREELEMRVSVVGENTLMDKMSENSTSRIELISKFYQKAPRDQPSNKARQSGAKQTDSAPHSKA